MKMRKWTAMMLAVCMLLSMLPGAAFAEGETENPTQEITQEGTQVCETCGKDPCECKTGDDEVCETCGKNPCECKEETEEEPCEHEWGEWEVTTEPGCETEGEKTRTCVKCEETDTQAIEAVGHEWDDGEAVEGGTKYTCALCGESHVLEDEDNSFETETLEETEPQAELTEAQKLQAAIKAAEDGKETTITMNADITGMTTAEIITVPEGKVIVLDMAGHSITVAENFAGRPFINEGTLTVTGDGTIDSSASESGVGAINNKGTLTIENGTFAGYKYGGGASIRNTGANAYLTVNGGRFEKATGCIYNEGTAYLYGGTYMSDSCSACAGADGHANTWGYALQNATAGSKMYAYDGVEVTGTQGAISAAIGYLEVNGGSYKTRDCTRNHGAIFYALYAAGEKGVVRCVINGGTFETKGKNTAVLLGNDNTNGDGGINADVMSHVNGGTFIAPENVSALKVSENTAKASILHGGTYSLLSEATARYVDPAVRGEAGNNVTLEKRTESDEDAVAKVDEDVYASLQAAIDAATAGQTVTLVADDVELSVTAGDLVVEKGVTVDLDSKKLTITGVGRNGITVQNGGDLTIKNGTIEVPDVASAANPVIVVTTGASVTLDKVEMTMTGNQNGVALYPRGDAAKVSVVNGSTVTAPNAYAVSTNASTVDNYNVIIELKDSKLIGNSPVLINVPSRMVIDNCEVAGGMHGVIVRGGTAEIKNSTISMSQGTGFENYFDSRDWGQGNMVNLAALTVGNKSGNAYQYPSNVVVENTSLTSVGNYPAVFVNTNTTPGNGVSLNIADNCTITGEVVNNIVAEVNGMGYVTLQAAIAAAGNGQTVTMLKDVAVNKMLTISKSVHIDMNGHKASGSNVIVFLAGESMIENGTVETSSNSYGALTTQDAKLTVKNMTVTSTGTATSSSAVQAGTGHWGSVTFAGTNTITGGYTGVAVYGQNDSTAPTSTVEINAGTSITGHVFGIAGSGSWDNTSITIDGGSVTALGDHAGYENCGIGIYHPQQGTLTINSGEIKGPVGIQVCGGEVTINDGANISSTDTRSFGNPVKPAEQKDGGVQDGAALSVLSRKNYGDVTVTVNGGTFTAQPTNAAVVEYSAEKDAEGKWVFKFEKENFETTVKTAVSGGTFSSDVTPYCVEGLEAAQQDESGKWVIVPALGKVAQIVGGGAYDSLQAAINAAQSGETVKLLAGVNEKILIKTSGITLDGNGQTITGVAGEHGIQVYCAEDVTLKNVTVTGAGKSGLLVNASSVKVEGGLNLTGNGGDTFWKTALNVSYGENITVTHPTSLTFAEGATLAGVELVYSDAGDVERAGEAGITINPVPGLVEVKGANCWTTEAKAEEMAVAKVVKGEATTYCATLQTAIDEAGTTAANVTLLKDSTESVVIAAGQNITLDIPEGVTLSNTQYANQGDCSTIVNNGTLTVTGKGTVLSHCIYRSGVALRNNQGATATLNGCTFINDNWSNRTTKRAFYVIQNFGTMDIYAPTIAKINAAEPTVVTNGWENGSTNTAGTEAVMRIHGGTFTGGWMTVKNDDWGNMVIEGGEFSPYTPVAEGNSWKAVMNAHKLEIKGGTFSNNSDKMGVIEVVQDLRVPYGAGDLKVSGGTFTNSGTGGIFTKRGGKGDIAVSGGTFSEMVNPDYCATGYAPVQNDTTYGVANTLTITPNRTSQSGSGTVTLTVTPANLTADVTVTCGTEGITVTPGANGTYTAALPNTTATYTFTATAGKATATCTVEVTQYTGGGGGGGTTGGGTTTRPTQPEENINEPDVPLAQPLPFIDVTEKDWFYDAVRFVYDRDMMKGTDDGTVFQPAMTTTRGMIVTILHRLEGEPEAAASSFSDVAADAWYTNAVNWAAANGIVKGFEDGTFRPETTITRQEMAAILSRYAAFKGYDKSAVGDMSLYNDKTLIGDWAVEDMTWAVGAKVLSGKGNNLLDPVGTTSRAEAAQMLKNFCEKFETSDEK